MKKALPHLDPFNKTKTQSTWCDIISDTGFYSVAILNQKKEATQRKTDRSNVLILLRFCKNISLFLTVLEVSWTDNSFCMIYSYLHTFIFTGICPGLHALFMCRKAPVPKRTQQPIQLWCNTRSAAIRQQHKGSEWRAGTVGRLLRPEGWLCAEV